MSRKPTIVPRTRTRARVGFRSARPAIPGSRFAGPRRSPSASGGRRFYQCLACGAPVDPMYGTGDGSWCPHCHEPDQIFWSEGRLPDPQLYGSWLLAQRKNTAAQVPALAPNTNTPFPSTLTSTTTSGESDMKQRKAHTGVYSCPECCVEYELNNETVLKCDDCGGPLLEGTVEDVCDEDEEAD